MFGVIGEMIEGGGGGGECVQYESTKQRRFFSGSFISSCSNTGSMKDDPYCTSRKNSLELIKSIQHK